MLLKTGGIEMNNILTAVNEKDFRILREEILEMKPAYIARAFQDMDNEEVVETFLNLPKELGAEVLPYMDNTQRVLILDGLYAKEDEIESEDYLHETSWSLAKKRIPWLLVLMISATFTGNIIKRFEDVLQSVVILAAFIPMLMDTGGNAGSQSSTLIIRGLALGDIKLRDVFKVMYKELKVSVITGIILAAVNFLRLYFFEHTSFLISFTVCFSLFFTVIVAKVVGGVLPIIAKRFKMDPAIMASPLITTIVDALALTIYFTMAVSLLGI